MDSVLSALHEVPGVTATLVFDAAGRLALHKGHAVYDRALTAVRIKAHYDAAKR